MTRQEINQQIGERELTTGEILKHAGGLLFEDLGKWLLLSLIVFLPTGFVLQYLMLQIPDATLQALFSGDMEALVGVDLDPVMWYFGVQVGMSIIWIITHLAAAFYTDQWLQASKPIPGFGEMMKMAVKRWPAGMLMPILLMAASLVLSTVMMVGVLVFPFLIFLIIGVLLLLSAVYYMGLTVTAIRKEWGLKAYKYAWSVARRKKGKAIGLILMMMAINSAASLLLEGLTSSFGILLQFPWLYCLVGALLSVIANLPGIFLAIGVTIYFVNQEQLMQVPLQPMHQELPEEFDV
ncbi:MAG: hypothetical protein IJ315_03750 [Firmicutes bacterium]|nr:hypothetical protein [Bacillota bacterium]